MKRIVWAAAACAALLVGCSSPHISIANITTGAVSVPVGGRRPSRPSSRTAAAPCSGRSPAQGRSPRPPGSRPIYIAPSTYDPAATAATLVASLSDSPGEKQSIAITIVKPSSSVGGIPGLSGTVNVTYDERDIPTISCVKSVDCYAVLGYIHARDRLFQMDFFRRAARGTLSELVGDAALSQDQALRTFFTSRSGQPVPEALYAHVQTDPLVAPALAAYTNGVNAFIATLRANPDALPAAYGQLLYKIDPASTADLPDWSDVDTVAVARLFQFQLSETAEQEGDYGKWAQTWSVLDPSGLTIGLWIQAKSPIEAFTLAGSGAPNAPTLLAQPGTFDVAPGRRSSGGGGGEGARRDPPAAGADGRAGRLQQLGRGQGPHRHRRRRSSRTTPHLSLQYPSNFHLSHLVGSADSLNVMGAIFPGLPATLIGRGTHVGWGVTVVGYDVTDLYVEKLVFQGQQPVGTQFNGNTVPFIVVPQTYKFRTATGLASVSNPTPVIVAPPHGPVISLDAAHGSAITVRWTGQETQTDDLRAFFRLNNAASVNDARQALEGDPLPDGGKYTGYYTGAQNFVLADDTGAIGYVPHACVPQRPWASSPAVYPLPVVPVDGRGTFEWASSPDGGLLCVPDDKLPRAIGSTKGYLATANADPLGVSVDNNPYSNNPNGVPYLSYEWDDQGYRIARIQEVLDAKTADGGKVTLADMQALQADHVAIVARPFLAIIQATGAFASPDPNVAAAATMLLAWGSSDAGIPLDCPTGLAVGSLDPSRRGERHQRHWLGELGVVPAVPHLPPPGARDDLHRRGGSGGRGPQPGQRGPRSADPVLRPGAEPEQPLLPDRRCRGQHRAEHELRRAGDERARLGVQHAEEHVRRRVELAVGPRAHHHLRLHGPRLPAHRPGLPSRPVRASWRRLDGGRRRTVDHALDQPRLPLPVGRQRALGRGDGRHARPHLHAAAGRGERERLSGRRTAHDAQPVGAEPVLQLPVPAL